MYDYPLCSFVCAQVITPNKLIGYDREELLYSTKEEKLGLLESILAAAESDMYEEGVTDPSRPGAGAVQRRPGNMASVSGADDSVYAERRRQGGNLSNKEHKHALFKKFRS